MPVPFNSAVLTNGGAALLTKAQAGECKIEFVKIGIGDGTYSTAKKTIASLQERTALKSEKNTYTFSKIRIYSEYSVKLTALLTNQDPTTLKTLVTSGYYINEMGIYAKESGAADSTAILYSVVVTSGTQGDYMPPYNGVNPAEITQDYIVTVNNSTEVTIKMTGAALLAEDANKIVDDTTNQTYQLGIDNGLLYYQAIDD